MYFLKLIWQLNFCLQILMCNVYIFYVQTEIWIDLVLSIYRIYLKFDSRSRFLSNQSFSDQQISLFLIWLRCIFWPLQLNFKPFHTNLEAIHSLNGCLCTGGVIETNKSEALALVGGSVDEDFAADNISKGKEHLHQLCISKLLRQMINEKVASFWSTYGATYKRSVLYLMYSFNFSKKLEDGILYITIWLPHLHRDKEWLEMPLSAELPDYCHLSQAQDLIMEK